MLAQKAHDSPCALLPELQRNKDDLKCAVLGAWVQGQRQKTADANLDCAFVENALLLHRSLTVKSQQNIIELVTRPGFPVGS